MSGQGSPNDTSGLRKQLRMALRYDGYSMNMVGSRQTRDSDIVDRDHEAVPGAILEYNAAAAQQSPPPSIIRQQLQLSLGYKPNVVIINGGTNNANGNFDVDRAYPIMLSILNDIWNAPDMSNTCVFLSTLLTTKNANGRRNRIPMNEDFRSLVDNESRLGSDFLSIDANPQVYADDVHPNAEGHKRLAYIFYAAIRRALRERKIQPAAPLATGATGCPREYSAGQDAGAETQNGSGESDGPYIHANAERGVLLEIESPWDRNQWRFARLFSRDFDDFVGWYDCDCEKMQQFGVWKNSADGQGRFTKIQDMMSDLQCDPEGVCFTDMNGDGLDDLLCIDLAGNVFLAINKDDGSGDVPPTFESVGTDGRIKSSEGPRTRIRLGDIDGDGRGDVGLIDDTGNVRFLRNGGTGDVPVWEDLGMRSNIAKSNFAGDIDGIRFEDINGDGRDDYLWVQPSSETRTWSNSRSCAQGKPGDGLNVAWREATPLATHPGISDLEGRVSDDGTSLRSRIFFARIFGSSRNRVFGNLGAKDYAFVQHEAVGDPGNRTHRFKIHAWENRGGGATQNLADGNKYCNMNGHTDGRMDYVWTGPTGEMRLVTNAEKNFIKAGESYWLSENPIIFTPPENLDRRDLHLADWDADGDCDIIWVNPRDGSIRVWANDFPSTKSWTDAFREISVPNVFCTHRRGIGWEDDAVRFADLTGNHRADYLCIAPNGTVGGYCHENDGTMTRVLQFKFSERRERSSLRFTDVNGDGRADMLAIDKFNGDGYVWYNNGKVADPADHFGSSIAWQKIDIPVYKGAQAGSCVYFPDLDGNGRADYHSIQGTFTNRAKTGYNPDCGVAGMSDAKGDDPEGVVDPRLPVQPGNPLVEV